MSFITIDNNLHNCLTRIFYNLFDRFWKLSVRLKEIITETNNLFNNFCLHFSLNAMDFQSRFVRFILCPWWGENDGENNHGEGEVATYHLGNKVVLQGGAWILRILRVRAIIMAVKFNILLHWKGILAAGF